MGWIRVQMASGEIAERGAQMWGCTERTVRNYIVAARTKLEHDAEKERPYRRHQMRGTLRLMLKSAMSDKQWGVARLIAKDLRELDGLDVLPGIRVEHSGTVEHRDSNMATEDKRRRMQDLLSMGAARSRANGRSHIEQLADERAARRGNGSGEPN